MTVDAICFTFDFSELLYCMLSIVRAKDMNLEPTECQNSKQWKIPLNKIVKLQGPSSHVLSSIINKFCMDYFLCKKLRSFGDTAESKMIYVNISNMFFFALKMQFHKVSTLFFMIKLIFILEFLSKSFLMKRLKVF